MQTLQKQRAHKQLIAADFFESADERGVTWGPLMPNTEKNEKIK
jgi:hypothetical protein